MTNNQLTDEQRVLAYVERLKAAATVYLDVSAKDVPFYDKAVARRPFDLLLHPSDLLILIASYEAKEAELQERRKAEKDSEPVADVVAWSHPTEERTCDIRWRRHDVEPGPLYRHAQQPVVPFGLHPDTQKLVIDFCTALAEKLYKAQLKYGYDADWKQDGWPSQCQAHFHQHIAKGDPRDVAAYCAFMWYHGWKTEAAQTAPVVTFYRDGIEAAAKWIDQQRESYDSEHGWSDPDTGAFEFGNEAQRGYSSTLEELAEGIRALHQNAGNSPAIPEGYVMVPMRLTADNGAKGALSGEFSETKFVNCPECFGDDECETCDGSGRIEITLPVTWTTIKEIWAKGVEHFAAAPQEVQVVSEKIEQSRKKIERCDVCTEGARGGCGTCAFNGNL